MYTISYRKIALELAALNLLILTCLSLRSLSFEVLCWTMGSVNVMAGLAFFLPRRVYQVQVQALALHTFRFAGQKQRVLSVLRRLGSHLPERTCR